LVYKKCLYDHELANKAYFSDITVKNISKSFTHKMVAKAAGIEITSLSPYVLAVEENVSFHCQ